MGGEGVEELARRDMKPDGGLAEEADDLLRHPGRLRAHEAPPARQVHHLPTLRVLLPRECKSCRVERVDERRAYCFVRDGQLTKALHETSDVSKKQNESVTLVAIHKLNLRTRVERKDDSNSNL